MTLTSETDKADYTKSAFIIYKQCWLDYIYKKIGLNVNGSKTYDIPKTDEYTVKQ